MAARRGLGMTCNLSLGAPHVWAIGETNQSPLQAFDAVVGVFGYNGLLIDRYM